MGEVAATKTGDPGFRGLAFRYYNHHDIPHPSMFRVLLALTLIPLSLRANPQRFEKPPHDYWTRALRDPFSVWLEKVAKGEAVVPTGSEIEVMRGFLKIFSVPVSSQMMVYSATSRQTIISPYRPRALYFKEDLYIGFVPGGRIEVASIDPEAGPVFRIFNFPQGDRAVIQPDRSDRCMQCHAGHDNHQLPKLVIDSVIVNHEGGSLETWRTVKFGHEVPLSERFGGWHLTGRHNMGHGNQLGQLSQGRLTVMENPPGSLFDLNRYPLPVSDILPQLLHDHQAGFHNLITEAVYKFRELTAPEHGPLTPDDEKELDRHAEEIVSYLLFKNEAKLPPGGITGYPDYVKDFQANRRPGPGGLSLKDLDLNTRLFRHRCSYMLYSDHWNGLPAPVRDRCWRRMKVLLSANDPGHAAWLPAEERAAIRQILAATLPEYPRD